MKARFRSPSIAKLREVYGDNAPQAKAIFGMTRAQLIETDAGDARVRECYHEPATSDIRMHVLVALEDSYGRRFFGVGAVAMSDGSIVDYLNAGDPYVATVYRLRGNYYVGDIGSLMERNVGSIDLQSAILRTL